MMNVRQINDPGVSNA